MPSRGGLPTRPGLRRLAIGAQVSNLPHKSRIAISKLERFSSGGRLISMRIFATLLALQLTTCFAQNSSTISLGNGIRVKVTVNTGNNTADPLKVDRKSTRLNSSHLGIS